MAGVWEDKPLQHNQLVRLCFGVLVDCSSEIKTQSEEGGADKVAAFIAETVVGATLGAVAAAPS